MKKGEIWLIEFPKSDGFEQFKTRPAIFLAHEGRIATVIPLTSITKSLRFPYTLAIKPSRANGLKKESIALIFQLRGIDKKRLIARLGSLDDQTINKIAEITKLYLNL